MAMKYETALRTLEKRAHEYYGHPRTPEGFSAYLYAITNSYGTKKEKQALEVYLRHNPNQMIQSKEDILIGKVGHLFTEDGIKVLRSYPERQQDALVADLLRRAEVTLR